MSHLTSVTRSELENRSDARLWALIDYLTERNGCIDDPGLQKIWLTWRYDCQVQNGGHLQYFHNMDTTDVPKTISALLEVGAEKHAEILKSCFARSGAVNRVRSLEEYSEMAAERSFTEDSDYYALKPSMFDILQAFYAKDLESWVAVEA
ncbi:MAG: DUF4375 domain-containing protein [Pseudomonadota bacterium]